MRPQTKKKSMKQKKAKSPTPAEVHTQVPIKGIEQEGRYWSTYRPYCLVASEKGQTGLTGFPITKTDTQKEITGRILRLCVWKIDGPRRCPPIGKSYS